MQRFLQWLKAQPRSHHLIAAAAAVGSVVGFALWWVPPTLAPDGEGAVARQPAPAPLEGSEGEVQAASPHREAASPKETVRQEAPLTNGGGGHIPVVRRPIPEGTSAAQRAQLEAAMKAAARDPENPEAWLNLGTVRKIAGDYEGAEEAWRYANTLRPSYVLPLVNLATLYALTHHNLAQAEVWFAKARAQNPSYLFTYQQYADVVSGVFQEHKRAEAFLRVGLASLPKEPALWLWLAEVLEREGGRGGDALYAYLQAKQHAQERVSQLPQESEARKAAQAILKAAEAGAARLLRGENG